MQPIMMLSFESPDPQKTTDGIMRNAYPNCLCKLGIYSAQQHEHSPFKQIGDICKRKT
jgi:hypothetical protein